jgi:DNA polymerase-3 subunit beta
MANTLNVTVKRDDLVAELQLCVSVVERKQVIPILGSVLLTATEDGRLLVAATDLDITLKTACEATVKSAGRVAIAAQDLLGIVRMLPDESVHIEAEENDHVRIQSGTTKFKIPGRTAEDFPILPEIDDNEACSIALGNLNTLVKSVIFAASDDKSRFMLGGAVFRTTKSRTTKKQCLEVFATDGHRLSIASAPLPKGEVDQVLIPTKAARSILKLEGADDARFGVTKNEVFIAAGRRQLIIRRVDTNVPDPYSAFPKDTDGIAVIDREQLLMTVRRIALIARGDSELRFTFTNGRLTVSSTNPDRGEATETIPIDYDGGEIQIGLEGSYIAQMLENDRATSLQVELKDNNTPFFARPFTAKNEEKDDIDRTYVIATRRLK